MKEKNEEESSINYGGSINGCESWGCSSTTSSSYGTESAESENNVRNSGEKVTLTVWQLKPEIADTLPEVFEVYMKENPEC